MARSKWLLTSQSIPAALFASAIGAQTTAPRSPRDSAPNDDATRGGAAVVTAVDSLRLRVQELERAIQARSTQGPPTTFTLDSTGFRVASGDGRYQIRLRGYFQSDGRFFQDDILRPAPDALLLRRVRPIWEATVGSRLDLRLMPDFGEGRTTLYDAYMDLRLTRTLLVRTGKFKPPIGLERLQSATDLAFLERAHPTSLAPNRDVGIQVQGALFGSLATYSVGFFDGVADIAMGDGDQDDHKDFISRVFFTPLASTSLGKDAELGLGMAMSHGGREGSATSTLLPVYRSPGQQSVFVYRSDGTAAGTTVADGTHRRVAPQGYFYAGPLGTMVEYTRSSYGVRRGTESASLDQVAWQVTGSWLLTGERASYRGILPRRPFDPTRGQWGAFEVALRATELAVDDDAFPVFADPNTQVRRATSAGAAFNWYLNRGVRLQVNYLVTRYAGGALIGNREPEHAVMTRLQHSF